MKTFYKVINLFEGFLNNFFTKKAICVNSSPFFSNIERNWRIIGSFFMKNQLLFTLFLLKIIKIEFDINSTISYGIKSS